MAASVLAAGLVGLPAVPAAAEDPPAVPAYPRALVVAPGVMSATLSWTPGSKGGTADVWTIESDVDAIAMQVPGALRSTVVEGLRPGVAYRFRVRGANESGLGRRSAWSAEVLPEAPGGRLRALHPERLVDTRSGTPVPDGGAVEVQVAGAGGVPMKAGGAALQVHGWSESTAAVRVLVERVEGPASSAPAVTAAGSLMGSGLTFSALGPSGRVRLRVEGGPAHVALDTVGWVSTAAGARAGTAGLLSSLAAPVTVFDGVLQTSEPFSVDVAGPLAADPTVMGGAVVRVSTTFTRRGAVKLWGTRNYSLAQALVFDRAGSTTTLAPTYRGDVQVLGPRNASVRIEVLGWVTKQAPAEAPRSYFIPGVGAGVGSASVSEGGSAAVPVTGRAGIPASDATIPATHVALSTVVTPRSGAPVVTFTDGGTGAPAGMAGDTVIVPVDEAGAVSVSVTGGAADVEVFAHGYFAGATVLSQRTVPLTGSALDRIVAVGPETITFAAGAPVPDVGQLVAAGVSANTPEGLLRQVAAVEQQDGGTTLVRTLPATLRDAVKSGRLGSSVAFDEMPAGAMAAGESAGSSEDDSDWFIEAGAELTYHYRFPHSLSFNMDVSFGRHPVEASLTGSVSPFFRAELETTGAISFSKSKTLFGHTFAPIILLVGGIPVVIKPELSIELSASATVSSAATFFGQVEGSFGGGVSLEDGDWDIADTTVNSPLHATGGINGGGAASASVSLDVELFYGVYGGGGPTLSASAELVASTDGCTEKVEAEVSASIGAKLDVFGFEASASFDIASVTIPIYSSGFNCTWVGTISQVTDHHKTRDELKNDFGLYTRRSQSSSQYTQDTEVGSSRLSNRYNYGPAIWGSEYELDYSWASTATGNARTWDEGRQGGNDCTFTWSGSGSGTANDAVLDSVRPIMWFGGGGGSHGPGPNPGFIGSRLRTHGFSGTRTTAGSGPDCTPGGTSSAGFSTQVWTPLGDLPVPKEDDWPTELSGSHTVVSVIERGSGPDGRCAELDRIGAYCEHETFTTTWDWDLDAVRA